MSTAKERIRQVAAIKGMLIRADDPRLIGKYFGVSARSISYIRNGERHANVKALSRSALPTKAQLIAFGAAETESVATVDKALTGLDPMATTNHRPVSSVAVRQARAALKAMDQIRTGVDTISGIIAEGLKELEAELQNAAGKRKLPNRSVSGSPARSRRANGARIPG